MFDFHQVKLTLATDGSGVDLGNLEYRSLVALRPLSGANSALAIQQCLHNLAAELGAMHFAFLALDRNAPESPVRWAADHAEGWWREITAEMLALSKASQGTSAAAFVPHTWFRVREPHRAAGNYTSLRALGIQHGLLVPSEPITPGSVAGCLALAFDDTPVLRAARQDIHFPAFIAYATSLILDAYLRLPPRAAGPKVKLSNRESECVRWAAIGKTSWETACILSLSERTVNFHLSNAFAKLNVNNKQAAVAQAILQDLI